MRMHIHAHARTHEHAYAYACLDTLRWHICQCVAGIHSNILCICIHSNKLLRAERMSTASAGSEPSFAAAEMESTRRLHLSVPTTHSHKNAHVCDVYVWYVWTRCDSQFGWKCFLIVLYNHIHCWEPYTAYSIWSVIFLSFKSQSLISFSMSLLPRSIEKRLMRSRLEFGLESHSTCNRLYNKTRSKDRWSRSLGLFCHDPLKRD